MTLLIFISFFQGRMNIVRNQQISMIFHRLFVNYIHKHFQTLLSFGLKCQISQYISMIPKIGKIRLFSSLNPSKIFRITQQNTNFSSKIPDTGVSPIQFNSNQIKQSLTHFNIYGMCNQGSSPYSEKVKRIIQNGQQLQKNNDYNGAIQIYKQALSEVQKEKGTDSLDLIDILSKIAILEFTLKKFNESFLNLRRCEQIYGKNGKPAIKKRAEVINNMGLALFSLQKNQEALECFWGSFQIYKEIFKGESYQASIPLSNVAGIFQSEGKFDMALNYFTISLQLAEKFKGKISPEYCSCLVNVALMKKEKENYAGSLENLQQCLQIREKIQGINPLQIAQTLNNIGIIFRNLGKHEAALNNIKKSIAVLESIGQKGLNEHVSALISYGIIHYELGKYDESIKCFNKAMDLQKQIGQDPFTNAKILGSIGNAYHVKNDLKQAQKYYEEAHKIYKELLGEDHEVTKQLAKLLQQVKMFL